MIIFAHPSKPFEFTAKNNVRRQAVLDSYQMEIEDAYSTFGLTATLAFPTNGEGHSDYRTLIDTVLHDVLGKSISHTVDLFRQGCDR